VGLTDKKSHANGYGRGWYVADRPRPSGDVPDAANLPPELWHALPPGGGQIVDGRYKTYRTEKAALAALSAGCVTVGRKRAGPPA
jgi:hypothetical protein